ncbi:MAG: hypothetical protein Q9177_001863 [Variospora cf. flavescens]
MSSDDEALIDSAIFQEPSGYYPPPKLATFESWTLQSGETLRLRLVGHNPLWGHHLWNGAQVVTDYLYDHKESLVRGRDVLELGAGAGLPSIAAAIWGAKNVVVTDYPDEDLVENMMINVDAATDVFPSSSSIIAVQVSSSGTLNAYGLGRLKAIVSRDMSGAPMPNLFLQICRLVVHAALMSTIQATLSRSPDAKALVFFTPYTPWKFDKDMAFFDLARQGGFEVNQVVKRVMDKVMFKDDRGDELLRRTVFGYELSWNELDV